MNRKPKKQNDKFRDSVKDLERALEYADKAGEDRFFFAGISKSFEVCLEYAWKYFKMLAEGEGFEVTSPKEAIKYAGRLKVIDDVEKWLDFLEDRNLAVHDYLGMSEEDYLKTIADFLKEVKKIK